MISSYELLKRIAGPVLERFWTGNLSGIHHVPRSGPCIVIANHASYSDFFVLASVFETALGRRLYFWAKSKVVRHPLLGIFARIGECIEVTRAGSTHDLWARSASYLEEGRFLCIFPEGTRSRTGELARFRPGYLKLASVTQTPILPVLLRGTRGILPPGSGLPRPRKARVEIHEPLDPGASRTRDELEELNDRIWRSIYRTRLNET
jgi:1-acyl-sn-glycerol-3-phosphate acyltransferase